MWGRIAALALLLACIFGSYDPILYVSTIMVLPYVWGRIYNKAKWRSLGVIFAALCLNASIRLVYLTYRACGGKPWMVWSTFVAALVVTSLAGIIYVSYTPASMRRKLNK
jgi:hypothetical protein